MADPRCTLYVSSCDKYSDLWQPFFELFVKYWPDCPYPIVLGAESKPFRMAGLDIRCPRWFSPGTDAPWGLLTMGMLDSIHTPYMVFMLDDFFLNKPVDQAMVERCLDWMDADPSAGGFILKPISARKYGNSPYPPFFQLFDTGKYSEFTQAGVWRKETPRRLLKPFDTPWSWEARSGERNKAYADRLYCVDSRETSYAPIDYPPGGVLRKGELTQAGARTLEDNGMADSLDRPRCI
ncbi:MAG: hypothetical protein LBS11_05545 [Oscillospiraceae bacterium]|jgi:hypothetical protein|nr:hypothetical protein [Oscillospiraceae bacterium]